MRRLRGYHSCLPPCKGYTEDKVRLSQSTEAQEAIGKSCNRGIWIGYKAKFFTVKAIKHWSRSTEGLQSPYFKVFRSTLDKVSEQPDLTMRSALLPAGGSPDDLQRSLPT